MAGFSTKANKFAQNGMRFLFAPELKSSFKPTGGLFVGFVKMVAEFLATAKLIPATHRALHPATARDARMGEVLALAYSNLRQPGARPDQYIVFAALVSLLGLITIMAVYTAANLLFGAAHAAALSLEVGPFTLNLWAEDGCSGGETTSLFTAPCNDMAQQWIDVLLLGVTDTWFAKQIVSVPVAAGLEAMFATYSSAMLVLGGLLVLYHMLAIVAGTAQEGKLGGRSMNQIWAPIRLVMAIGLLVPIGYHGLNSGQVVVVNVAKWGSGLATNIWIAFANSYAANSGAFIIAPPVPMVTNNVRDAMKILVCMHGMRTLQQESEAADTSGGTRDLVIFEASDWINIPGDNMQQKSWDYKKSSFDSSDKKDFEGEVCGNVRTINPTYGTTVNVGLMLGSTASIGFTYDLKQQIVTRQKEAIDSLMASDGTLDKLAKDFFEAVGNTSNSEKTASTDFAFRFNDAVLEYRQTLNEKIGAGIAATGIGDYRIVDDAIARGWMSASVWFNTIARYNGLVLDYSQEIPKVNATNKADEVFLSEQTARIYYALYAVDKMVSELNVLASNSSRSIESWAETSLTSAAASRSSLDYFLALFAVHYRMVLGGMFADNEQVDLGSAGSAALSSMQLQTANPLAELSAIGQRMISSAMKIFSSMDECASSYSNDQTSQQQKLAQNNACSGKSNSFGGTYFMTAMLSSMIAAGVTLGYMLPLLPFIRFMFGILSWILALIETVIAIPVVALAHIKMDGEGLSGPMARGAYLLLLQLFLRPTLMVFGLIAALLIFNFMIVVLNEFYTQAVAGATDGGGLNTISLVIYTIIYASLAYAFANASFKAIDMIPNQVLLWIGGPQGQTVDESHRVTGAVSQAASVGGQGLSAHSIGQGGGSHRYIQGASDDPAMKKS